MPQTAKEPSGEHRAAKRALEVIEHVAAARGPVSLSELSRHLELPKSSAHALVRTLSTERYLDRAPDGGYSLGPRLLRLISRVRDVHVPRVARPVMQRLVDEFQETALLGVRQGDAVIYVEQIEPRQFVRYAAPLGTPRPLHCTSIGKLFLADLPEGDAERLLRNLELEAFTEYTKVDVGAILSDLAVSRTQGFAINREESISGVTAIAAFVHEQVGADRYLVAGLSLVGPTERMRAKLPAATKRVVSAAREITGDIAPE